MSNYRIEIAVPRKGARKEWPTYRLTEAHIIAAVDAIWLGVGAKIPRKLTPAQKRLARWVADYLLRARRDRNAFDWLNAENARRTAEKSKRKRKASR